MDYLTLDEIKKQCNIDPEYTGDDEFLEMIGDSAENLAEQFLDCPLEVIESDFGEMPATVKHAMRMLVDYLYAVNRGSADNDKEIPNAALVMLKLFRKYN